MKRKKGLPCCSTTLVQLNDGNNTHVGSPPTHRNGRTDNTVTMPGLSAKQPTSSMPPIRRKTKYAGQKSEHSLRTPHSAHRRTEQMQLRCLRLGSVTGTLADGRLKQDDRARRVDAHVLTCHEHGDQTEEPPNKPHCNPQRQG